MIALVDCNNFFVSCERIFRPDLWNKPVCVLSNNDGCVIARSNEVKAIGVKMGEPVFKCKHLFEKHNVTLFSTNFPLYGNISKRVMGILSQYSNKQEIYSIDESFLELKPYDGNYQALGEEIRSKIDKWVGVPTCVGMASTKTLAKIANHIAKKYPQLEGVHIIDTEEKRIKALKWIPIEEVWGVGRKNALKMKKYGIRTAQDYVELSDTFIKTSFTIVGLRMKYELLGVPSIPLEHRETERKSISHSRTFSEPIQEKKSLEGILARFVSSVMEKLRDQKTCVKELTVYISTSRFAQGGDLYNNSQSISLPVASSSTIEVLKYSKEILSRIYRSGYKYKKMGIILSKLVPQNSVQTDLFDKIDRQKDMGLMKVLDSVNSKMGKGKLGLASEMCKTGKVEKENLSPEYTTKWSEILEINI